MIKKLKTQSKTDVQSSTDDLIFDDFECLRLSNKSLASCKISLQVLCTLCRIENVNDDYNFNKANTKDEQYQVQKN